MDSRAAGNIKPGSALHITHYPENEKRKYTVIFPTGLIMGLGLFHCAEVVHEHKGASILGIAVPLRPLVPRTKVAGWVVDWERGPGWRFLLASVDKL